MDITTVAHDFVVAHEGATMHRFDGLEPASPVTIGDHQVTTLPRPQGMLRCRFGTVNDLHFGEEECGSIDGQPGGPIQRADPGDPPYPDTMNRGAVAEMAAANLAAVIVKGDLSVDGHPDEWQAFEDCYRAPFVDRLFVSRGNHDAYHHQADYAGDQWIELPGITVALLDTVTPGQTTGDLRNDQIEWLDDHAASTTQPVIVMGHHQQWISGPRSDDYFGLHPDASDALNDVAQRRTAIVAYTAGHTHRHRVRPMACGIPSVEIGCVKDFPGTWAEYLVYDGGITQVVHRVSTPEALRWSERCRHLYADYGVDYETYALGRLEDRCFNIPLR